MRISIDTESRVLTCEEPGSALQQYDLYSDEAFYILSEQWLKIGWNQKYAYTFAWLGRPVIQLPEDLMRIQEVIFQIRPDVILETGVAHGGSLVFYAGLCKILGKGRVIGIDIEIRQHNRRALEEHDLSQFITLIEGDSAAPATVQKVKSLIDPSQTVLVILDSAHTQDHVRKELEAYNDLVTVGSYLVVTDGIMKRLFDVPRGRSEWKNDNPVSALQDFLAQHLEFAEEQPARIFSESGLKNNLTYWPHAWLKKTSSA